MYEGSKDKAAEGYDAAADATKATGKAGLKLTSDAAEKVQGTADAKHEEL